MLDLNQEVALVTGASQGLDWAMAHCVIRGLVGHRSGDGGGRRLHRGDVKEIMR